MYEIYDQKKKCSIIIEGLKSSKKEMYYLSDNIYENKYCNFCPVQDKKIKVF
jgi:hypothetical protein